MYLASYPGMVLSQEQIFEAVWSMDSDSCQFSVVNVIYNLRKKIEPDSKKPTYIKTVIGIGYKFDMQKSLRGLRVYQSNLLTNQFRKFIIENEFLRKGEYSVIREVLY